MSLAIQEVANGTLTLEETETEAELEAGGELQSAEEPAGDEE